MVKCVINGKCFGTLKMLHSQKMQHQSQQKLKLKQDRLEANGVRTCIKYLVFDVDDDNYPAPENFPDNNAGTESSTDGLFPG